MTDTWQSGTTHVPVSGCQERAWPSHAADGTARRAEGTRADPERRVCGARVAVRLFPGRAVVVATTV